MALTASAASAQSGLFNSLKNLGSSSTTTAAPAADDNASGSLASLLSAASTVLNTLTGLKESTFSIVGTWTYNGCAMALESSTNVLSNLASSAAASNVESKIDAQLAKIGIIPGSCQLIFTEDGNFSIVSSKKTLTGTWEMENGQIVLKFGKIMKLLTMKGHVAVTSDGCELLFDSTKFLTFIKNALSIVGSSNATFTSLQTLLQNFDTLKLGYKLVK